MVCENYESLGESFTVAPGLSSASYQLTEKGMLL